MCQTIAWCLILPKHLISTYSIALTLLIPLIDAATYSTTNGANHICSTDKDRKNVCTNATKLSVLSKFCNEMNITMLDFSKLNASFLVEMKLDFCTDIYPMIMLVKNGSMSRSMDFPINSSNPKCRIYLPEYVNCSDIQEIYTTDKLMKAYHNEYMEIINRSQACTENENSTYQCSFKCQEAYKEWLCSQPPFHYRINNTILKCSCQSTRYNVCLYCPDLKSSDQSGGQAAFECYEHMDKECNEKNVGDYPCKLGCISSRKLKDYIIGGNNG